MIAGKIVNQVLQFGGEFRLGFQAKELRDGRIVGGRNFLGFDHQPFQRNPDHRGARGKMVVLEEMRNRLGEFRGLKKRYPFRVNHLGKPENLRPIGAGDDLRRQERPFAHRDAQHFFLTHGFQVFTFLKFIGSAHRCPGRSRSRPVRRAEAAFHAAIDRGDRCLFGSAAASRRRLNLCGIR